MLMTLTITKIPSFVQNFRAFLLQQSVLQSSTCQEQNKSQVQQNHNTVHTDRQWKSHEKYREHEIGKRLQQLLLSSTQFTEGIKWKFDAIKKK